MPQQDAQDGHTASGQHYDFDVIVIGAGPAGENAADYATRQGLKSAIVESELVGGECSYWACMPSKALLRSGDALRAACRVPGSREAAAGALDAKAVLARRDAYASNWDDAGQVQWLDSAGIELIRGQARISGRGLVQVEGRQYAARAVVLATGSAPVMPGIDGLSDARPWSTREATAAAAIPPRLAIIGGGVAAVEMAFAYASLGSKVAIFARGTLLSREEPFAGQLVAAALAEAGVAVHQNATPVRVRRDAHGIASLQLLGGGIVEAEELLVATGRRPNLWNLGLEAFGVDPAQPLQLDDTMLVAGTDWLYAVGDASGRSPLTHQGKYQARAAGEAMAARINGTELLDSPWGRHAATADHHAVPRVVFGDPQIAAVGLTERQAREAGLQISSVEHDLGAVAGAALHAEGYSGRAKLVIDSQRSVILGATFAGQDAAELLHAATVAIVGEVSLDRLWHAVPAYPTISEIWLRLLEAQRFG
ncbi:pyridine nucleotide-disulfide oxidoreductase [Arthrobacter sp. W1]|nr:pyridine nucleotide-disulfide oxidoreductase [Arthrobacter sp. W1]